MAVWQSSSLGLNVCVNVDGAHVCGAVSGFGFSLLNGLGAAAQAALNADVLPQRSDNAARDMQLIQATPGLLPGIVIPLVSSVPTHTHTHIATCHAIVRRTMYNTHAHAHARAHTHTHSI